MADIPVAESIDVRDLHIIYIYFAAKILRKVTERSRVTCPIGAKRLLVESHVCKSEILAN